MADASPRPALGQQVTFLYAANTDAAWRFYEDVMGLTLVQDQGSCRIYESAPGARAFLGVCSAHASRASDNPRVEGGVVFTFVVDDVDGWYSYLLAKGVAIPTPPSFSEHYRVHHFFFHDPAGYTLEIQRFERPDWIKPTG